MLRRRSILLLESVIALLIMGVIIQLLFTGYRQGSRALTKAREEKEAVLKQERVSLRLKQLFDKATSCREGGLNDFALEYTGGIDPDPHFRGALEGRLYVEEGELRFVTEADNGKTRLEILYDNVSSIALSFFDVHTGSFSDKFPKVKPPMIKVVLNDTTTLPLFL